MCEVYLATQYLRVGHGTVNVVAKLVGMHKIHTLVGLLALLLLVRRGYSREQTKYKKA